MGPPAFIGRCFGNGTTPTTNVIFAASPRLLGRTSAGGGPGEEISVDATLTLAALTLARAAITGDVSIPAGSNVSTIPANTVQNAQLAQAAALTVKANPTNALADEQDLAATSVGQVLQVVAGPLLAFATPPVPGAGTVPLASLVNAAAQYDIIGRKTAGAGAWEDCINTDLKLPRTDQSNTFGPGTTQTFDAGAALLSAIFYSSDAGATGPVARFNHDTATPANADVPGQFQFFGRDSGATVVNWGSFAASIVNVNSAAKSSLFQITTYFGNVQATRFKFGGGFFTSNATGGDQGNDTINASDYFDDGVNFTAKYAQLAAANVFTASPQVINKNAQPAPTPTFNTLLQLNAADATLCGMQWDGYGVGGQPILYAQHAGGTQAAKTATLNGDATFQFLTAGYDGTAYVFAGSLLYAATENWGVGATGGRWTFRAAANGTGAAGDVLRIQAGLYSVNATDPGLDSAYFKSTVRTGQFTVATLPAAATVGAGARAYVTDALGPAFGAAVVGGGAVGVPVYSTGAAWNVG